MEGSVPEADCLIMALYSDNFTIGPEGIFHMLLVLEAISRPIRSTSAPSLIQGNADIDSATKVTEKEQEIRRIYLQFRHHRNATNKEHVQRLDRIPISWNFPVFRQS